MAKRERLSVETMPQCHSITLGWSNIAVGTVTAFSFDAICARPRSAISVPIVKTKELTLSQAMTKPWT